MFIELMQGSGDEESRCPYCYSYFKVQQHSVEERIYGYRLVTISHFVCQCPRCNHYVWIDTTSEQTQNDGYIWEKYMYVMADEWLNHQSLGDEVKETSKLNEVYINNNVANEDTLWQQISKQPRTKVYHNRRWRLEQLLKQRATKSKTTSKSD